MSKAPVIVICAVIIVAGALALTKYKLPARNVNLTANTSSTNSNVNRMPTYPFSDVTDAEVTNVQARIKTAKGDIVIAIDATAGPLAAKNFVSLIKKKYYDGVTFHRVEPGFVIQGGDPTGMGNGGPGYKFPNDPVTKPYVTGTLAMANAGPNTNGSQFFVCLDDLTAKGMLAPNYSIFGQVTSGMDVVKAITKGDVMTSVTLEPLGT